MIIEISDRVPRIVLCCECNRFTWLWSDTESTPLPVACPMCGAGQPGQDSPLSDWEIECAAELRLALRELKCPHLACRETPDYSWRSSECAQCLDIGFDIALRRAWGDSLIFAGQAKGQPERGRDG